MTNKFSVALWFQPKISVSYLCRMEYDYGQIELGVDPQKHMQFGSSQSAQSDLGSGQFAAAEVALLQLQDVEISEIGKRYVLRNRKSGAILLSNTIGAQIFAAIKRNCDHDALIGQISEQFDSLDEAYSFIRDTLGAWKAAGLFLPELPILSRDPSNGVQQPHEAIFALDSRGFLLLSDCPEVFRDVASLMKDYATNEVSDQPLATIKVRKQMGAHMVFLDSKPVWRRCSADEARFLVIQVAISLLAGQENVSAVMHAAAVVRNGQALLLAGASGKGKTTLALLLSEHGWKFAGDDLIGLSRDGTNIYSLPLAARVKNANACEKQQLSCQTGTFVWPQNSAEKGALYRISAVIFPSFSKGANFVQRKVSPENALQRFLTTGTEIVAGSGSIAPLTELLNNTPIQDWNYGNNNDALHAAEQHY